MIRHLRCCGMLAAVIERGDDEVIGTQGAAVKHVAHRMGGVDPELNRNISIPGGCASPGQEVFGSCIEGRHGAPTTNRTPPISATRPSPSGKPSRPGVIQSSVMPSGRPSTAETNRKA